LRQLQSPRGIRFKAIISDRFECKRRVPIWESKKAMKIGTFNLRDLFDEGTYSFYFNARQFTYTADFVQKRVDSFSRTIRKMDPDILFLQEVASEKVLERIIAQTKSNYSHFIGKSDWRGIANAVLFRLPNCSCVSVPAAGPLPVFVEGDEDIYGKRIDSLREFVRLETTYHGLPLTAIGIHSKSSVGIARKDRNNQFLSVMTQMDAADGLIRSTFFKLSQARRLRGIVDSLFSKEGDNTQIIVLGDFNAMEDTDVMRIIKGDLKGSPTTLLSACDVVPERKRFSHIKKGRKRLIDHILVSKSIQQSIRSVKIFNEKLRDQTSETAAPLIVESDHAPIMVELT
jgi:endonuclease/exonuclease/phosphatase family metal-dependent hydrolase